MANIMDLTARVNELERQVEVLCRHVGLSAEDLSRGQAGQVSEQVRQLARDGKRVAAIKLYCEQTGSDLMTARNLVNSL